MRDEDFESRILRFEQARQRPAPCRIEDHLAEAPASARFRLLVEMICIDLEFGWRANRPAVLAEYVERFPELISLDALPVELIGEEYRARCRWGDRPSHATFLSQFHERSELIQTELNRIDEEIDLESPRTRQCPHETSRIPPIADEASSGPLRSYRDFLLRRWIGAGRMGKVYEASLHDGGRTIAVKFLRKSFLHDPAAVRRFIEEARTIARLRHPRIVGTEGLGRTPGGSYFIVMDLVKGPNLAQIAGRRTIAVGEAIGWAMQTCEALEHAHERGIVHCDLKTANLLLDESGNVRVTDFGLARSLTEEDSWASGLEGTVPFMAPEQADRCWGPIDHRADVYGIGAVLFALLTGRPPFLGRRLPDVLAQVVGAMPAVSPASLRPDIPEFVNDLCRKCLAKEAGARFQSVREIREALERAIRPEEYRRVSE